MHSRLVNSLITSSGQEKTIFEWQKHFLLDLYMHLLFMVLGIQCQVKVKTIFVVLTSKKEGEISS